MQLLRGAGRGCARRGAAASWKAAYGFLFQPDFTLAPLRPGGDTGSSGSPSACSPSPYAAAMVGRPLHRISPALVEDAGEVLTLQRAAYVTEAQLYGDFHLPALTQSLDDLCAELKLGLAFKATLASGRVVGGVRARFDEGVLHVGRLIVAPDQQGKGIGSALLQRVEGEAPAGTEKYALFTGHLSSANLRLYERHGYLEVRQEVLHPGVTLVHMEKACGTADAR